MPPPIITYTKPYKGGGRHPSTVGPTNPGVQQANKDWQQARRALAKHQAITKGVYKNDEQALRLFAEQEALQNAQSVIDRNKQKSLTQGSENPLKFFGPTRS